MSKVVLPLIIFGSLGGTSFAQGLSQFTAPGDMAPHHEEQSTPRYIMDVTGKRVRIVGSRFYANPRNQLDFPGRNRTISDNNSD